MAIEAVVRAQVAYPRQTGLGEDTQTNTIHFATEDPLLNSAALLMAAVDGPLETFLQTIDINCDVSMFSSPATVDWFDLSEPKPRVPMRSDNVVMTYGTGTSLPLEVSMVLSFEGTPASGVNQARRRGRLYLPTFLNDKVVETSARVVWTSAVISQVSTAFSTLAMAVEAADAFVAVYSQTTYDETPGLTPAKLDAATTQVTRGWIDNEPDTQRRRGSRTGTKTPVTWGV